MTLNIRNIRVEVLCALSFFSSSYLIEIIYYDLYLLG